MLIMQLREQYNPDQEEPSLDTRWSLADFRERTLTLLPEITDLMDIEQQRTVLNDAFLQSMDEEMQTHELSDLADSIDRTTTTAAEIASLTKSLALAISDPEEFGRTMFGAWEQADTTREGMIPADDKDPEEPKERLREHMLATAGLVYKEAGVLVALHERYRSFGHEQRVELLQLLLKTMPVDDIQNRMIYSQMAASLCAETPLSRGQGTPMMDMIDRLKNRELDDALWWTVAGNPEFAARTPAIQKLTAYVLNVAMEVAPDASQDTVLRAMGNQVTNALNGEANELHWVRNHQIGFLERLRDGVIKHIGIHPNFNRPEVMKQQLVLLFENMLFEQFTEDVTLEERKTIDKRRNSNKRAIRRMNKGEEVEATAPELPPEPRALVAVAAGENGYETTDEDPEAAAKTMISEYAASYNHDKNLLSSLERALDYIRRAEFSKGKVPGIRKQTNAKGLRIDNDPVTVYELNPIETPGLGNRGILGRTRLLFALDKQGRVCMLDVEVKDKLAPVYRRLGLYAAGNYS